MGIVRQSGTHDPLFTGCRDRGPELAAVRLVTPSIAAVPLTKNYLSHRYAEERPLVLDVYAHEELESPQMQKRKEGEFMKGTKLLLSVCIAMSMVSPVYAEKVKDADLCRFGIAALFGRSPETMKTKDIGGGVYKVSYVRKSDGTHWHNKCRVEGHRIVWGAHDGRWRTHPADSKVTFELSGDSIIVKETHGDGSSTLKRYWMPQALDRLLNNPKAPN